jgi:hypothetical protein
MKCNSSVYVGRPGFGVELPCEECGGHVGDHQYLDDDGTYTFTVRWSEASRHGPED